MTLIEQLASELGPGGLLTPADDLERYVEEPRGRFLSRPLAVARPASAGQTAAVVGHCREAGVAVVPAGGLTGLVGGAAALGDRQQLLISFDRLRGVREIDADGASLTVEAGCTLAEVHAAADSAGMMFPLSLASDGSATVGGAISTNAGGNLTVRYGNMRRQVLGLEVVLADGRIWNALGALRKDNSGYDLKQCFIGSEGTLGLVTAATLALAPAPQQSTTVMLGLASVADAVGVLGRLRRTLGETLSAFEFLPRRALEYVFEAVPGTRDPFDRPHEWYALVQADSALDGTWLESACFTTVEAAIAEGLAADAVVAGSQAQAGELWRLRESISPAQQAGGASLKHDVSLPVAAIPDFIATCTARVEQAVPGVRPCVFGHLADGNLHFNLSRPRDMADAAFREREREINAIVFDAVAAAGGSFAAEHGIGQLRPDELRRRDPGKYALMVALKRSLDPDNRLNPGKVVTVDGQ